MTVQEYVFIQHKIFIVANLLNRKKNIFVKNLQFQHKSESFYTHLITIIQFEKTKTKFYITE